MRAPTSASEHYEQQKRLTAAILLLMRRQWRRMPVQGDWDAAWRALRPSAVTALSAGRLRAARDGAAFVPRVLAEQGMNVQAVGVFSPAPLIGAAADGRPLGSLLDLVVPNARAGGSLEAGEAWLDMVVQTELADAQRAGETVAIAARPRVGYVRMVNTPCCKDCAVQAGRFFRVNTGFLRHANCRCYHLPTTDPRTAQQMVPDWQGVTGLTKAETRAMENGADLGQVVNAARGRSSNKMTTTEGTTKRGQARPTVGAGRQRLSPDGIAAIASNDDEMRRLLKAHGYLI